MLSICCCHRSAYLCAVVPPDISNRLISARVCLRTGSHCSCPADCSLHVLLYGWHRCGRQPKGPGKFVRYDGATPAEVAEEVPEYETRPRGVVPEYDKFRRPMSPKSTMTED